MWEVGEKKEEGKRVGSLDQETDCVTTSADSGRNWCFCPTSVVLATPPQFVGSSMLCRATILCAGDYILISSHDIACEDTQSR